MPDVLDYKGICACINSKASEMENRFPAQINGFLPWVGTRYDSSVPRLLILGESTYPDPKSRPHEGHEAQRFCDEVIKICEVGRFLKAGFYKPLDAGGKRIKSTGNFMRNIVTYLTGDNSQQGQEFVNIWENWAFWELIPGQLDSGKSAPTAAQFKQGWNAFEELVRAFDPQPSLVIGLGYRMRDSTRKFPDQFQRIAGQDDFVEYLPAGLKILFLRHPSYQRVKPLKEHERFAAIRDELILSKAESV